MKSEKFSFDYWDVWSFVKGRKKMAITLVAAAIGYVLTNSELSAIIAGGSVEMAWSVIEYYAKEQEYELE